MDDKDTNTRRLRKNNVEHFILRVDLLPDCDKVFSTCINNISLHFDRMEKRIIEGITFQLSDGEPILSKKKDFEYVLVSDSKGISMTFSKPQQAFWLETTAYVDNSAYKEVMERLYAVFLSDIPELKAKRIGMRFVNSFPCKLVSKINSILCSSNAKILSGVLEDENLTRAIVHREYNSDSTKSRVQFGVTNRFYPSVISTYDVSLDIDVYCDNVLELSEWKAKISDLNHEAYARFIKMMNDKYIETLK